MLASSICIGLSETITFDDLPSTPFAQFHDPMPAGYAGFDWDNFRPLNGSASVPSGYRNGVVSPNNVIYSVNGNPAQFTNAAGFDLISAYVTAAWNDGLQVEVQGFIGTTMAYDNFYSVNTTGPTLINFNYLGVIRVKFITSGGTLNPAYSLTGNGRMVMLDNLTIIAAQPPIPSPHITNLTCSVDSVILSGNNGPANRSYYVLSSTNSTLPVAQWDYIATNQFDAVGHFENASPMGATNQQQFYLLQVP